MLGLAPVVLVITEGFSVDLWEVNVGGFTNKIAINIASGMPMTNQRFI